MAWKKGQGVFLLFLNTKTMAVLKEIYYKQEQAVAPTGDKKPLEFVTIDTNLDGFRRDWINS